jgi:hypothetical protein
MQAGVQPYRASWVCVHAVLLAAKFLPSALGGWLCSSKACCGSTVAVYCRLLQAPTMSTVSLQTSAATRTLTFCTPPDSSNPSAVVSCMML